MRVFYNAANLLNSNTSKNFARWLDNTLDEYKTNYNKRVDELLAKVEATEITEEESQKLLGEEFPENYVQGTNLKGFKKLAFTLAHNKYYRILQQNKFLELRVLGLAKEGGEIIFEVNSQKERLDEGLKFIRYKKDVRDLTLKSSYDEAVIINLEQVPKEIGALILQVRVPKVQVYAAQDVVPEGL